MEVRQRHLKQARQEQARKKIERKAEQNRADCLKYRIKKKRLKKRDYFTHVWMRRIFSRLHATAIYKMNDYKKRMDSVNQELVELAGEYMRGIITDEEYMKERGKKNQMASRLNAWYLRWQYRSEYVKDYLDFEEQMCELLKNQRVKNQRA